MILASACPLFVCLNIGCWLHACIIFLGSELSKLTQFNDRLVANCHRISSFQDPVYPVSVMFLMTQLSRRHQANMIMTKQQSSFCPSAVAVIENKVAKTSCIFFSKPTQCQKHIRCQPWILQCLD